MLPEGCQKVSHNRSQLKSNTSKAIYAENDEEYASIVADMISQAKDYGYDECIEWCQGEAELRAAAEDAAMADE